MNDVRIIGMGHALPDHRMTQRDAAEMASARCCADGREEKLLSRIYQRTSVRARGSVLLKGTSDALRESSTPPDATAPDRPSPSAVNPMNGYYPDSTPGDDGNASPGTAQRMQTYASVAPRLAAQAAQSALDDAKIDPRCVRHLVTVSCTGFQAPGVDIELIDRLGLPADVSRSHIGFMGCHGAINGLRVVQGLSTADPGQAVLMCCVELCSLHFQYGFDAQQMVANALFADGAAALVSVNNPQEHEAPGIISTQSQLFPDSRDAMSWTVTDHGFAMTLSPRVPELIERGLRPWLEPWLRTHGLSLQDIGGWAVHPGGPRVLDAAQTSLGLPDHALAESRSALREHGNMSSPTVLLILERLLKQANKRPCVALAFGPGLAAEAALIG